MKKVLLVLFLVVFALPAFAQGDELAKVVASLMPYIKEEIKGTSSETRMNTFFNSEAFKKSGFQKDVLNPILLNDSNSAIWDRTKNKLYLNKKAVGEFISLDLKLPLANFSQNKENMRKLAVCVAPIYVHEVKHQMESAQLRALGIMEVPTRSSEYIAFFEQYVFMSEKQLSKGKNYYASCAGTDGGLIISGDRQGPEGIMRLVIQRYGSNPQVFAPFDRDHMLAMLNSFMQKYQTQDPVKLEAAREADFKKDLTRLGIIKPGEKVLITVDEYLKTGRYNWNRITLSEFENAYQGKNALFNKYNGWFEKEMALYKNLINSVVKRKQLSNSLSVNEIKANINLAQNIEAISQESAKI